MNTAGVCLVHPFEKTCETLQGTYALETSSGFNMNSVNLLSEGSKLYKEV